MKESAAWRECAEWVTEGEPERRVYLCFGFEGAVGRYMHPFYDTIPNHWPARKMLTRIRRHRVEDTDSCFLTRRILDGGTRNSVRALFCLFMEIECKEAGK